MTNESNLNQLDKDLLRDAHTLGALISQTWRGKWIILFASFVAAAIAVAFISLNSNEFTSRADIYLVQSELPNLNADYDYPIKKFLTQFLDSPSARNAGLAPILSQLETGGKNRPISEIMEFAGKTNVRPGRFDGRDSNQVSIDQPLTPETRELFAKYVHVANMATKQFAVDFLKFERMRREDMLAQKLGEVWKNKQAILERFYLSINKKIALREEQLDIARALEIEDSSYLLRSDGGTDKVAFGAQYPPYLNGSEVLELEIKHLGERKAHPELFDPAYSRLYLENKVLISDYSNAGIDRYLQNLESDDGIKLVDYAVENIGFSQKYNLVLLVFVAVIVGAYSGFAFVLWRARVQRQATRNLRT